MLHIFGLIFFTFSPFLDDNHIAQVFEKKGVYSAVPLTLKNQERKIKKGNYIHCPTDWVKITKETNYNR